ncbi:hypothetical protein DFQ27_009431 [Actinomortierella ambigua]|uniref:Uncharacterized protein n=1 Tax=Actinomortierella ambigua TaxID=1343610 RepID=A0A9P6PQI8_9FUNG|nr:hypothetical protein DFQ27_009431 [Actinomortierella ambigua]
MEDVLSIEESASLDTPSWPSSPAAQAPPWPPKRQMMQRQINPTQLLDRMIDVVTKAEEEEGESSSTSSSPMPSPFHLPDYVEPYRQQLKQAVGIWATPLSSSLSTLPSSSSAAPTVASVAGRCSTNSAAAIITSDEEKEKEGQQQPQGGKKIHMTFEQWKDHVSIHRKRKPQMPRLPSEDTIEMDDEEGVAVEVDHVEEDEDTVASTTQVQDGYLLDTTTTKDGHESIVQGGFHTPKRKKRTRSFGAWTVLTHPRPKDASSRSPSPPSLCSSPTPSDIMARRPDTTPSSPSMAAVAVKMGSRSRLGHQELIAHAPQNYSLRRDDTTRTRSVQDGEGEASIGLEQQQEEEEEEEEDEEEKAEKGKGYKRVEPVEDHNLEMPMEQQGSDVAEEAMVNDSDEYRQQESQQQQQHSLSRVSYDGYEGEKEEDEQDEEESDGDDYDDAVDLAGPAGFVTPKRKRTRSLYTPPPAPKSPTGYFTRRFVYFPGHVAGQSPSSLARRH